jgi:hypothetical protein
MRSTYDPKTTALLCIDFYNDFLSEGGKLWPWVEDIAQEVNLLDNLRTIVRTAREAGIKIYHVPHHRWEPGDYVDWKYPSPYQLGAAERQAFGRTLGVDVSQRLPGAAGRYRCNRALGIERLSEHRPRTQAEALWQGKDHLRWSSREHLP